MPVINGTSGNDTLADTSGNDTINGLAGNDTINGGNGGTDVVNGGDGRDSLQFMTATGAVVVDFVAGTAGNTSFTNIEKVVTGDFNDQLTGNASAQNLTARAGMDTLAGAGGIDTLWGGAGADTFVFREMGTANADSIGDWASGSDTLLLDGAVMSALGAAGDFTAGDARFWASSTGAAHDADDRIIFNSTTRQIFYDADGNGSGAAQLIATLQTGATLVATDIAVEGGSAGGQVISGGDGRDTLVGTTGNDTMDGGNADDTLRGMAGDDLLVDTGTDQTNGSSDILEGGTGNDTLRGNLGNDRLTGGTGNDELVGGEHRDTYVFDATPSAANADVVIGFGTNFDHIVLDANAMTAIGSTGDFSTHDPRFHSAAGASAGHDADDRVIYDTSSGRLWYDADGSGGAAAQLIATFQGENGGAIPTIAAADLFVANGSASGQTINGTAGDDSIVGTAGGDTISGLGGNDTILGNDGSDSLDGGAGNDFVSGGGGFLSDVGDVLIGGDGDDTLDGGDARHGETDANVDTLNGGLGNDRYVVDNEADVLVDAGGVDTVVAVNMDWTLGAGFENLVIASEEQSAYVGIGNELDNHMEGNSGARLEGRGGDDTLIGDGESGGGSAPDLIGGDGNDLLQVLEGHGAFLDGGAGNDTLEADDSATMTGGAGADAFRVLDFDGGADFVTDFASGTDRVELDGRELDALGPSGAFTAGDARFHAAAGATQGHDADDRLIYDTASGSLFYDPDGDGSQTAEAILHFSPGAALAATDFFVLNGTSSAAGTEGDDSLVGTSGNDLLSGLGGNDTLVGQGGHDTLDGGSGADSMVGGADNDTYIVDNAGDVTAEANGFPGGFRDTVLARISWTLADGVEDLTLEEGAAAAIQGTGNAGRNTIHGNSLNNVLDGGGGDDSLFGFGGDDTLTGLGGNLFGGDGNDRLSSGGVFISLNGDAGNDLIEGGSSAWGGDGDDTIIAAAGGAEIRGGAGADSFVFQHDPNGSTWDRYFDFTTGSDALHFDGQVYTQLGSSGAFAAGDERFHSGAGARSAHDASDRLIYDTSTGELFYDADGTGAESAVLVAMLRSWAFGAPVATLQAADIVVDNGSPSGQVINGTSGADTLADTAGNDTINGLAGNDTINGGNGGNDVVNGGDGRDTLQFMTATSAVVVDFVAGTAGTTSFTNIERVITGDFNDQLTGNGAAQTLTARAGMDTLAGAGGNDTLWGGAGADTFIFRETGTANADTIGDWSSGSDEIALDNSALTALGADGDFVAGDARFWASSSGTAHDANDRVIYNTSTRGLYYDADGNGSGAAQLIATVQAGAAIAATDIVVI